MVGFRCWRLMALLVTLAVVGTQARAESPPVRVVNYNQYPGTDITKIATTPPGQLNQAVDAALQQVAAYRFRDRAARQAQLIQGEAAQLVALEEVWRFRRQELPPVPGACRDPSIKGAFLDQLDVTLAALRSSGRAYEIAALVRNFNTADIAIDLPVLDTIHGLPFNINGRNALLLGQDRDVILQRQGVSSTPVQLPWLQRIGAGLRV